MSEPQHLDTTVDLKAVDVSQRLIEGHAAAFSNKDRQGDVIDPKAFDRTLRESPDVLVFIGHDASRMPVGEPISISPDAKGLLTRTRVYNTPAGDELLEVAKQRLANGRTLGMSIGFRARKDRFAGGARHLTDIDLLEYSFLASPALAANPEATVTGVKGKSQEEPVKVWTAEMTASLPDTAFAWIDEGGTKDDAGLTFPRAARHHPHHDEDGIVDAESVTVALAEALKSRQPASVIAHLLRHDAGHDDAHSDAWKSGNAPRFLRLMHVFEHLALDSVEGRKAQERVGLETKDGDRAIAQVLSDAKAAATDLAQIIEWAESIEKGEDGRLRVEMFKAKLAMLQLEEVS